MLKHTLPFVLCLLAPVLRADDGSETIIAYLDRYHRLSEKDIAGRMELAAWCAASNLPNQQISLLAEVLKLQPGHVVAYADLIKADSRRSMPVDRSWAEKLQSLIDGPYRLHHGRHFSILSDVDDAQQSIQAEAMEEAYATYFREMIALGLHPMPPPSRLLCLLFAKHDAYRDFLRRYEGINSDWPAGFYSWRTNRVAFYHDRDNPAFAEPRQRLEKIAAEQAELREQMRKLPANDTLHRVRVQEQLRRLSQEHEQITQRFGAVVRTVTLNKARHEVTHQLLFNTGIFRRGRDYPFWISEGLAMVFESADEKGRASPKLTNEYRLRGYRQARDAKALMPLDQLLTVRPADDEPAASVAQKYAQAWALTHFLWNRRPEQLRNYVESLDADNASRDPLGLFFKHLGKNLDALERELRESL